MIVSIQVSGKTEEEAISSALAQLGKDIDEVTIEVIERAKSGFLGIGSSDAVVKVSYDRPETKSEKAKEFLSGLFEHMNVDADVEVVSEDDSTLNLNLVGEHLGALIGRRGETLDAIQHLTNYSVNRGAENRVRINIDAENYRAKRTESLERLANKVAGKVTKYKRNITLEPMNAYERHVIHTALQGVDGVTTYSTGTEPNRRVVVAYDRPQQPFPSGNGNVYSTREWN